MISVKRQRFGILSACTPMSTIFGGRYAATRLRLRGTPILEIALDCGFGDVSNFLLAFQEEFGVEPSDYRKARLGA